MFILQFYRIKKSKIYHVEKFVIDTLTTDILTPALFIDDIPVHISIATIPGTSIYTTSISATRTPVAEILAVALQFL